MGSDLLVHLNGSVLGHHVTASVVLDDTLFSLVYGNSVSIHLVGYPVL